MKDKTVILFTRIPVPGRTKTRLETFLSPKSCAQLHMAFIMDIYNNIRDLGIDIIINYSNEGDLKLLKDILGESLALENRFFLRQEGKDLGERMNHALSFALKKYKRAVLIGSDLPLISKADIETAFNELEKKDTVIAPTYDGGYYLIGLKEENSEIFRMKYSRDSVFQDTIEKIKMTGKTFGIGNIQLDIDEMDDLLKLKAILEEDRNIYCPCTREVLNKIMSKRGRYG